jgi:hypothetical protein
MGAFACKDHFGSTARHLADNGYEVRQQLQHEQGQRTLKHCSSCLEATMWQLTMLESVPVIWWSGEVSKRLFCNIIGRNSI